MSIAARAPSSAVERLLRRDRAIVLSALVAVTVLSWLYIVDMSRTPAPGFHHSGSMVLLCCGVDFWVTFLMWAVMMVGMMVPSAAPMVLMFAAVNRTRAERGTPYVPTFLFLSGYLMAWTGFSAIAAALQWALFRAALLNPASETVGAGLAGALLLVAGAFQLTPMKNTCLVRCRSPIGFLMTSWREGRYGAFDMGLRQGAFCIGCCWMLMALLFVAGVMNLLWVAVISAYVLAEKVLPWGRAVSTAGALGCLVAGAALLGRAAL